MTVSLVRIALGPLLAIDRFVDGQELGPPNLSSGGLATLVLLSGFFLAAVAALLTAFWSAARLDGSLRWSAARLDDTGSLNELVEVATDVRVTRSAGIGGSAVRSSWSDPASLDYVDQDHDNRHHEQQMDESTKRMHAEKSDRPKHQQDHCYRPQHVDVSSIRSRLEH
jgi:hypothetical protein